MQDNKYKWVYFVRHGESEGNTSGLFSSRGHFPLTDKGREQAEFIAERCKKLSAEAVISSTMKRAFETAEAIIKKTGSPLETSDLFVERRAPSELEGKEKISPEAKADFHLLKEGLRISDEENFDDIKKRAGEALDFLAARPERKIIVVTHGYFLKVMAARVIFGSELGSEDLRKITRLVLVNENTALSVFAFNKKSEIENPWRIFAWNDHAHLG